MLKVTWNSCHIDSCNMDTLIGRHGYIVSARLETSLKTLKSVETSAFAHIHHTFQPLRQVLGG